MSRQRHVLQQFVLKVFQFFFAAVCFLAVREGSKAVALQASDVPHKLPPRPEGFVGKLDHYCFLADEFRPKKSPRGLQCVTTADFSDGPGSDVYYTYYLYSQRHYWLLYVYADWEGMETLPEAQRWFIYSFAKKGKETAKTAAIYLLIDTWTGEQYSDPPLIENEGILTVEDLVLVSKAIWGREPNISDSLIRNK